MTAAPADARPRVTALNMGPTDGFDAYQPYINLVKGTLDNWSLTCVDANGEVRQLPPGRTIAMNVWYALAGPYQKIKPGPYVVKWRGGDATLTITCAGAVVGPQAVRRRTCTLAQVSDTTSNQFNLAFTNDTGAPIDIRELVVCHASHETLLDAGEIFNPDYLEACGSRLAFIRTVKPMGIENSLVVEPAQLKTEAHQSWCGNEQASTGGMPYTVAAKLAAKLGCNLHAPVPIRGSQALYDEIARQIASVRAFTGIVDAEVGNENWNDGYNSRAWLNNVYGPAQRPALNAPQAEAQKALMWFAALGRHLPRARIRRLFCAQLASGFAPGGYVDLAMRHVDTAGVVEKAAPFHTLIDEVRVAPYCHPSASAAGNGSGLLYHHRLKNIDWATRTDAQIDALYANGLRLVQGWLESLDAYFATLRPALPRSSYEWGQECMVSSAGQAGAGYLGTISKRDNTLVWDASTPASFTDGDQWLFFDTLGAFPSAAYRGGALVYIKAKDPTRAWFFASDAARRADTNDTGSGAIALDAAQPNRLYAADNRSRTVQFGHRLKAYLDSAAGEALYRDLFAATIGPGKLREACVFHDVAGYGQGNWVFAWGLKSSLYAPDTPRYRWWKSL